MKERPIIFKPEMVKAILDDRKTQTRRLNGLEKINKFPNDHKKAIQLNDGTWTFWYPGNVDEDFANKAYPEDGGFKCPYGAPGDRLWVRETWLLYSHMGQYTGKIPKEKPFDLNVGFKADEIGKEEGLIDVWPWKPSIFMPRWASRINLEVLNVRVERLQEIIPEECRKEGVQANPDKMYDANKYGDCCLSTDSLEFREIWDSINAKKGFGWEVNPWVWVVEFKRIRK